MSEMTAPAQDTAPNTTGAYSDRIRRVVAILARQLSSDGGPISAGDRAELRRGWENPHQPAFWRLAVRVLEPAGVLNGPEADRNWAAILAGLAETASLHDPRQRFGRAMGEADVSEARLLRLLRADAESLRDALRAVVRQLGSAGERFDWREPALLLLLSDKESIRKGIAMSYYRSAAAPAATQTTTEGD